MTPAAHWSPDDYYRASRRARRLWELAQAQLQLDVLDRLPLSVADGAVGLRAGQSVERVALNAGGEPHGSTTSPPEGDADHGVSLPSTPGTHRPGVVAASINPRGGTDANTPEGLRVRPQKGA